jgi:hypothetical protein
VRWLPDWLCRRPEEEVDTSKARYTANRYLCAQLEHLLSRDPDLEFLDALHALGVPLHVSGDTTGSSVDLWRACQRRGARE